MPKYCVCFRRSRIVVVDFQTYFKRFQIINNKYSSSISFETLKQIRIVLAYSHINQLTTQNCRPIPLCLCNCQLLIQVTGYNWIISQCEVVMTSFLDPCTCKSQQVTHLKTEVTVWHSHTWCKSSHYVLQGTVIFVN